MNPFPEEFTTFLPFKIHRDVSVRVLTQSTKVRKQVGQKSGVSHRLSDTINSRMRCRSSCRRHTKSWMLQLYFSPSNPDTVLEGPHRISASSLRGGKNKFRTQVYSEESIQRRTLTQINFLRLERSTAQLRCYNVGGELVPRRMKHVVVRMRITKGQPRFAPTVTMIRM